MEKLKCWLSVSTLGIRSLLVRTALKRSQLMVSLLYSFVGFGTLNMNWTFDSVLLWIGKRMDIIIILTIQNVDLPIMKLSQWKETQSLS